MASFKQEQVFRGTSFIFPKMSSLEILDLSYNKLSGDIPAWIGTAFSSLKVLKLRSNAYSGGLRFGISKLTSLHILDLVENNLSGIIPSALDDLIEMAHKRNISKYQY